MELPTLIGSEKQIEYANQIRKHILGLTDDAIVANQIAEELKKPAAKIQETMQENEDWIFWKESISKILLRDKAEWWIESFKEFFFETKEMRGRTLFQRIEEFSISRKFEKICS